MHAYGGTADWVAEGVGDLCGARLHLAALQVVRVILLLFLLGSSLSLCSGRLLWHGVDGEWRLCGRLATLSIGSAIITVASAELNGGATTRSVMNAHGSATLHGVAEGIECLSSVLGHLERRI